MTLETMLNNFSKAIYVYVGGGEHSMITTTTLCIGLTGGKELTLSLPVSRLFLVEGKPFAYPMTYPKETEVYPPVSCSLYLY